MKLGKIGSGLALITAIWFIVSMDIILMLNWIDAFFPSVLTTQMNTFFDGVIQVILTVVFFVCTYALVEHYGEEY